MNDSHLSLAWQGYSKTKEGDFLFARERPNIPSRDKLLNQSIEKKSCENEGFPHERNIWWDFLIFFRPEGNANAETVDKKHEFAVP